MIHATITIFIFKLKPVVILLCQKCKEKYHAYKKLNSKGNMRNTTYLSIYLSIYLCGFIKMSKSELAFFLFFSLITFTCKLNFTPILFFFFILIISIIIFPIVKAQMSLKCLFLRMEKCKIK